MNTKNIPCSKEFLYEEYVNKEKTILEIAEENGFSYRSVRNAMEKYEIPARKKRTERDKEKLREAHRLNPRKGFHLSLETRRRMSEAQKGNYRTKTEFGGHKKQRKDGYVSVYVPDHPFCNKDGRVMEHILVMEKHIGRYVQRNEVVHHINHIRNDNRIENLRLIDKKEHASLHSKERWNDDEFLKRLKTVKNVTTGEVFVCARKASEKYGVSIHAIRNACLKKAETCCGCVWEYERR